MTFIYTDSKKRKIATKKGNDKDVEMTDAETAEKQAEDEKKKKLIAAAEWRKSAFDPRVQEMDENVKATGALRELQPAFPRQTPSWKWMQDGMIDDDGHLWLFDQHTAGKSYAGPRSISARDPPKKQPT